MQHLWHILILIMKYEVLVLSLNYWLIQKVLPILEDGSNLTCIDHIDLYHTLSYQSNANTIYIYIMCPIGITRDCCNRYEGTEACHLQIGGTTVPAQIGHCKTEQGVYYRRINHIFRQMFKYLAMQPPSGCRPPHTTCIIHADRWMDGWMDGWIYTPW